MLRGARCPHADMPDGRNVPLRSARRFNDVEGDRRDDQHVNRRRDRPADDRRRNRLHHVGSDTGAPHDRDQARHHDCHVISLGRSRRTDPSIVTSHTSRCAPFTQSPCPQLLRAVAAPQCRCFGTAHGIPRVCAGLSSCSSKLGCVSPRLTCLAHPSPALCPRPFAVSSSGFLPWPTVRHVMSRSVTTPTSLPLFPCSTTVAAVMVDHQPCHVPERLDPPARFETAFTPVECSRRN